MNVMNPDLAAPDTGATPELTARDFTTDQEVRWCPGCGDYAILKAVRGVLAAFPIAGPPMGSTPSTAAPPPSPPA